MSFTKHTPKSSSFSSHYSAASTSSHGTDETRYDPHDVHFPGGMRSYECVPPLPIGRHRHSQSFPPAGLKNPNFYEQEDEQESFEKLPLKLGENFSYPTRHSRAPNSPYLPVGRESLSLDRGWRHRQQIERGVKRKVKLTDGHFIAEYRVPTAVSSALEQRYSSSAANTTEFSYVCPSTKNFHPIHIR